ncbi:DUF2927 domain-containing protein [Pontibacter roseus]|uniref:DUF2927 domain-containing protein n=1 Tax=Pontibacter roseus TaxID=336989 RepID=UPI00037D41E5|nr:DUF2927 domain-containing protein [Pontibacter roseus]
MKRSLHLLSIAFLLFLASCSKDEDPTPPVEEEPLTAEQQYFLKIALGSELGQSSAVIRKWSQDMKVFVPDSSNTELMTELKRVMGEINGLSQSIQVKRVMTMQEANYVIFLSDKDTYARHEPNAAAYVDNNWGLFWIYWTSGHTLTRGSMYVDVVRNTDINCMKHLLREELTQSLGLMIDTEDYAESIFYQRWTCTPSYAEIDKKLISYILNPKIQSGMGRAEVIQVLRTL